MHSIHEVSRWCSQCQHFAIVCSLPVETSLTPQNRMDQHLDETLKDWPYDPAAVSVRIVTGSDHREVIQMRVELGVLQLETTGRPDGVRPQGAETYFDHLIKLEVSQSDKLVLNEDQCVECDREFVQFYHRRICWLALQRYEDAVRDADHHARIDGSLPSRLSR